MPVTFCTFYTFCLFALLLSISGTDASVLRKRKADEMEQDEQSFLVVTAMDVSWVPLHSKPSFQFESESDNGTNVTLQVNSELELRIEACPIEKVPIEKENSSLIDNPYNSDDEESDSSESDDSKLVTVQALYCNIRSSTCKSLLNTKHKVEPGNMILLSNRRVKQGSLDTLLNGLCLGVLHRENVQGIFKFLFCCSDIRLLFVNDLPEPIQLQLPEIPRSIYKESRESSIWTSWPLRPFEEHLERFEAADDKDEALLKMERSELTCLYLKYPQIARLTELCKLLTYKKPWCLYTALKSNTFLGEEQGANLVVALFLIERDPENLSDLVTDFESILQSANAQEDEERRESMLTRLSMMYLTLFGVRRDALQLVLKKYPPGFFFLHEAAPMLNEPSLFIHQVDAYEFFELTAYDFPLLFSLLRHFLVVRPSKDIYLRTLLWIIRTDSRYVSLGTVDLIRKDVEDEACYRTWQLALSHCSVQVRKRLCSKKRAPMRLFLQ